MPSFCLNKTIITVLFMRSEDSSVDGRGAAELIPITTRNVYTLFYLYIKDMLGCTGHGTYILYILYIKLYTEPPITATLLILYYFNMNSVLFKFVMR